MENVLSGLLSLGVGAWVGGFITVFVMARSSATTLDAPHRVRLFRHFGRKYAAIAGVAMAFILIPAAILSYIDPLNTPALITLMLAVTIIALSVPAIAQARRIGMLRREALDNPKDASKMATVERASRSATLLRTILGVGSVGLLVLAVLL